MAPKDDQLYKAFGEKAGLVPDGVAQIKVWQSEQVIDVPAQSATIGATLAKNAVQLTVVPRKRRT